MDIRRRMIFRKKASSSGGSTTGGSYTVNLNGQWEKTTAISNPDSTLYDGVYRSSSNYNVNSSVATMYITIKDCSSFKMYIRSYAESNYDYVMVSQLDKTITGSSSYSDTTLVKAHTRGNQQSGTALSSYTLVEFTGISSGEHTITVVYRKDGSQHSGDDRGYVLIPKSNGSSDSGSGGDDEGGSSEGPINIDNYLTILALEDGLTASLSTNACEYCIDGDGNWKSLTAGTATESINSGHTLSFKGNLTISTYKGVGTFTINKKCNLEGNCMSMLFGDNAANNYSLSGKSYAFYKLFYKCTSIIQVYESFLPATTLAERCYQYMFSGCSGLTTAPELPATTLDNYCYQYMFDSCTSLTTAPELPATTLASSCYSSMFYGCSGLTTVPELPATTLDSECYQSMFNGCKGLTVAPELPATTLANYCYYGMFRDCTNLTTAPELPATTLATYCYHSMFNGCKGLTVAPELPATTLASSCYHSMFSSCSGLTTAPELPATTIGSYCYSNMFYGCSKLTTAPELPATTLATYCYHSMFYGCSGLTTAPELPATTLATSCYGSMFNGCKGLTVAPELPATTLATYCYQSMFYGCTKLNYIKMLATNISASSCLSSWVYGVSSTGTFVKNPAMTSLPTGTSGIPSGWTVVDDGEVDIDTTYAIYYTSSDGNIVTPYRTDRFGANFVSNNYINGQGIISCDGPITTIGENAFYKCTSLTSVTIPNSVTSIGYGAFAYCSSLTSITIPDSVTTIGVQAFQECTSLKSVNIPDGVTEISRSAYVYCSSLTSITIPDSVTKIGNSAFAVCSSLTSVYCKRITPPSLGSGVFSDNGSDRKIYVPTSSVNAYKRASGWSNYANEIEGYDFEDDGGIT